jgi:MFS family permease
MDRAVRNVVVLAVCQGLTMIGTSTLIAEAALVGDALAGNRWLSTLPLALQQLMTMATTIPASYLMLRIGRRNGFMLGAIAGIVSALLATAGAIYGSFVLFCVGVALNGVYTGFSNYYRFAAIEGAGEALKARAVSWVMAGGVISAVVGPWLARQTHDLLPVAFAGSFLSLAFVAALAVILLRLGLDIPAPSAAMRRGGGRSLAEIARQPVFIVAVLGAVIGYAVMSLVMNASPLAMQFCGHSFSDITTVIQWHLVAMFAPSFVTGRIIERFGVLQVMLTGAVLLVATTIVSVSGVTVAHFWVALVLLGVGWNFLFVGGTTLVTEAYRPEERATVQAANDFMVFGSVAVGAFFAGVMQNSLGWDVVNITTVPFAFAALLGCAWLIVRRRAQPR